jgi:hypothetical protein
MCSGCLIMGSEWNMSSVMFSRRYFDNRRSSIIECHFIVVNSEYSYIHHGPVGNRNKFPSCQCEILVSCGNDENQTALK